MSYIIILLYYIR